MKVFLAVILFVAGCVLWCTAPRGPLLTDVAFGAMVLDSKGEILRLGLAPDDKYRLRVTLDEIAPAAVAATLAYEDRYFFQHPGINPVAFGRALLSLAGKRRMGASTVTMQLARLLYRLNTTSISGKLQQIWLALALEVNHSKQEILEAYFNLAPYGGNIEGIEAASRIYFHKPASALTLSEASALAIVPQNPGARNPVSGSDFNKARRRMQAAPLAPLKVFSPAKLPFGAPHLALELEAQRPSARIQTAIERDLQGMLERSVRGYTNRKQRFGISNAAALLLRWTDMQVCGLVGSADFHDLAINGQIDGSRVRRSPGSTLKPFIYGLALDQGLIHPRTILPDSPRSYGGYDPENFDRGFQGPVASDEALRSSRNLPALYLAGRLRDPDLYGMLRSAEVNLQASAEHYGLALALGGAEVTVRELAGLYALLANQGIWQPVSIEKGAAAHGRRILSPEAAWLVIKMLGRPEATVPSNGHQIPYYYKTGTSNGFRDAWTCGIIGQYVLIVWVGNFDNRANPNFIGASAALPLFGEICAALGNMRKLQDLTEPSGLNLLEAQICKATGDLYAGQCDNLDTTWLIPGVSPTRDSGVLRKILVDVESGLRSCVQSKKASREVWWEFWPSDLRQIFAKAGICKPEPPAWLPECESHAASARAPRIILPKKNVAYQKRVGDSSFRLPLLASADFDAGRIHWFAGQQYLGSASPGETIYWDAPCGIQMLQAVDDSGRSVKQECRITALP